MQLFGNYSQSAEPSQAWPPPSLSLSFFLCLAVVFLLISRSLPSNGSTCHIDPSLRLFVPNDLQAYRYFFFSWGCACDVCDRPRLPSPWLGSRWDYSPTVPVAPCLRLFVLSGSLMRCQPNQVYHHHASFPRAAGKSSESGRCSYFSGS
jgi:hypothetical protein